MNKKLLGFVPGVVIGATLFISLPLFASSGLAAAPSPCDTVGTPFLTITQNISNDADSGLHGNWAVDAFTENVSVWVGTDGTSYCANANTTNGAFVTAGGISPEQGTPLAAGITGTFTGGENYIFASTSALVLNPDYSTTSPQSITIPDSSTAGFSWWVNQVFPSVASTTGSSYVNTYSLTYVTANNGTWTDADLVSGGDKGDLGAVVDTNTHTGYSTLQAAINAAHDGDTIQMSSDMTISSEVTINKPVTIDGANHTLFAAINNSANSNSNNAGLGIIEDTGDVTIKNLTIDGIGSTGIHDVNIFDAANVTLDSVTVQNASKAGITVNGANVTVNNVTTAHDAWGGINVDLAADATNPASVLTVTGTMSQTETGPDIWRDDNSKRNVTVNVNSQYSSKTYTHDVSVVGTIWGINTATASNETELRAALSDTLVNTITLSANITLAAELDITRAVTIDGAGHTIGASFNGASVIQITANDVTLKNLVEDGTGTTNNRGINIYVVTGTLLDNVTASNNTKNGIVVNGSTVTVNNITTSGNGWEGIDVDMGVSPLVTTLASLTVNGTSIHNETKAAIRIDDTSKVPTPTVTDTNNQYTASTTATLTDYFLKAKNIKTASSSTETTSSGSVTVTADIPSGTIVSGDSSWDGIINPPTATTTSVSVSGFTTSVTSAISIGSSNSDLTFNKAVKLTFAGQAGQHIGWYNHVGTFTEITTTCTDNSQTTNDGLAAGGSCKIDSGSDLVVWTKHFSVFMTYTQTAVSSGGGGGGGGGGGNGAPAGTIGTTNAIIPTTGTTGTTNTGTTNTGTTNTNTGTPTTPTQATGNTSGGIAQANGGGQVLGSQGSAAGNGTVAGEAAATGPAATTPTTPTTPVSSDLGAAAATSGTTIPGWAWAVLVIVVAAGGVAWWLFAKKV